MQIIVIFLCLFVLLGRYSCFIINTDKSEEILSDIGRQFIAGIYDAFDEKDISDTEDNKDNLNSRNQHDYPIERDEHQYVTIVVDPLGTAVGTVMRTYTDKPFYSFMGIRFATAGTFEMPAIYEELWDENFMGGYDASYIRPKCPQGSSFFPVATGDQDCLFLNVYTPQLDEEDPTRTYPVMVFIHGGAFSYGDASFYVPSRLVEEDVIVVTIQYRLGSFGFLYSKSTSAPGNMGLMDQVVALRWVKKYIQYFNGDDENVTVFGESAGSASTSFLQLSPQTSADYNNGTQLLNRIILQSGSAIDIWTIDRDYDVAIVLHGQATGCYEETYTADDIVNCMKVLPTKELVYGYLEVLSNGPIEEGRQSTYGTVPVIQHELLNNLQNETLIQEYIVIPREPLNILEEGDFLRVDVMAGSNRDEGTLYVGAALANFLMPNDLLDDESFLKHELMPLVIKKLDGVTDTTGAVSNAFRLAFLPNVEMGNATQMFGGMIDLEGMMSLKAGPWRTAQLLTRENPDNKVFFYSFEFEADDKVFDWLFFTVKDMPIDGGVSHADELMYLFSMLGNNDDREGETVKKMTMLWANFAYYGDPTPDGNSASWVDLTSKWLPYSFEEENFLLMEDEFVLSEDFVKRWNYNIL